MKPRTAQRKPNPAPPISLPDPFRRRPPLGPSSEASAQCYVSATHFMAHWRS